MITAKKYRKIIERERLEISSRIRDSKGTFHAKMGTINDRNGIDLTEAEDIKKRWQEDTQMNYTKKVFMTQITTEPNILECEVKWALGSLTMNKASGGGRIAVELLQILNDNAVKVL